jgi:signal transduction histidine kinase
LEIERVKANGERNEEIEEEIITNIKENEEKINYHGKRADSIVRGMLEHSRSSTGVKEPTDINKLADEYLRLSYHGMRAKDKNFNVDFRTEFDNSIGKMNINPQDIGRVILNLINNAFYAVRERQKVDGVRYEPIVTISTVSIQPPLGGRSVQIKVADNGGGVPKNIVDKIFQPFFTTKPTGQGTGLGLSLAYDIAKSHGGEIKVETGEREGSTFIIQLPAN